MDKCASSFGKTSALKAVLLIILTLQATFTALLAKYSLSRDGPKYIKSTVVIWMELFKFVICNFIILIQVKSFSKYGLILYNDIMCQPMMMLKVAVPSLLYVLQNNLLLMAYNFLDIATFQITYQLKILTTALFSVILLKKHIKVGQWIALVILTIGIGIVGFDTSMSNSAPSATSTFKVSKKYFFGLGSILAACFTSGFAGVFLEKMFKKSGVSMWVLNIQLSSFGIVVAIIVCLATDFARIKNDGFFIGYDYVVWGLAIFQALGGLVIAMVIKYADNILKGFSTSISIILNTILSYFIFTIKISNLYIIGTAMVIHSVVMYAFYA